MEYAKYADEIKKYCDNNHLNFSKIAGMAKGCGANDIVIQYRDKSKGKDGLKNETRMPVVLRISIDKGKLVFEQTEHTKKYLS